LSGGRKRNWTHQTVDIYNSIVVVTKLHWCDLVKALNKIQPQADSPTHSQQTLGHATLRRDRGGRGWSILNAPAKLRCHLNTQDSGHFSSPFFLHYLHALNSQTSLASFMLDFFFPSVALNL
jgi:hypothetical protein